MPILFALILSFIIKFELSIRLFAISISPDDGLSIKDKILSSVDFPEPDGPTKE